jgi:hypothetical protein
MGRSARNGDIIKEAASLSQRNWVMTHDASKAAVAASQDGDASDVDA